MIKQGGGNYFEWYHHLKQYFIFIWVIFIYIILIMYIIKKEVIKYLKYI